MTVRILQGDSRALLKTLPANHFQACVTSPPYFNQRDYGVAGQIGLETSPTAFVEEMVSIFTEVHRVLRPDGTLWLNLGDSYANDGKWGGSTGGKHVEGLHGPGTGIPRQRKHTGLKPKDLIGIPWRVSFALQEQGWWLRDAIIWAKPNGMPGSQEDRCTSSYEMIFQLSKSANYFSDFDAIKTPPRESTMIRTAQDVQAQAGSHRANGVGVADSSSGGLGEQRRSSQPGRERHDDGGLAVGGMGYPEGNLGRREQPARGSGRGRSRSSGTGLVGDAERTRLQGQPGHGDGASGRQAPNGPVTAAGSTRILADAKHDGGRPDVAVWRSQGRAADRRPYQGPRFWDDAEWVNCSDGKARPIGPDAFPLGHGIRNRAPKLRAYGNAIVPQVAAEFIAAYMAIRGIEAVR